MTIKRLVLPGGGAAGIRLMGTLQRLHEKKIWNVENIETIYSVSAGSLLAVLLALKFNWETITDYIIKRPWSDVYKISLNNIFDIFLKKGFYDVDFFITFFKPFFDSKDISINITLKQLYDITGVDCHFCTVELNSFVFTDVSHENYPDLEVVKAVQMSAAYPVFISPVFIENKCYIDGGLLCNYPINICVEKYPDKSEIL